ncbi:lipase [Fructobacillus sp. M1-13]|uniref:Lipase n=1 Tax=Fructobacillus papyriferae TaxID=2713171 RepID=A0ABS5QN94_9LACO|nr:lipase [Fructobacillus papyriferae]MBS9334564.1 lipase [Fructobacillus papyriferae]MCD2158553.1 lipase [Fructobacillus papyriferae]
MISDVSYNKLATQSYFLDPGHSENDLRPIEGKTKTFGNADFRILRTINHRSGMQAMAVAPIVDGQVDTSEVVIAYAGTNIKDLKDSETDVRTVGGALTPHSLVMEIKPETRVFGKALRSVRKSGQLHAADAFASRIETEYPNAKITTTGHSLGEYTGLYVAAEHHFENVGFNGPDPFHVLSPEAKKWAKNHPERLMNYRNRGDFIGNLRGNRTGAGLLIDMGKHLRNFLGYHDLAAWDFSSDGNLLIPETEENLFARMKQRNHDNFIFFKDKLKFFSLAESRLKASNGGSLSSNAQIYLDDSKVLAVVERAQSDFVQMTSQMIQLYRVAMQEARMIWDETFIQARSATTELSDGEIREWLGHTGFTYRSVVTDPCNEYSANIRELETFSERFLDLLNQIRQKITGLVQQDAELAQQIQGLMG